MPVGHTSEDWARLEKSKARSLIETSDPEGTLRENADAHFVALSVLACAGVEAMEALAQAGYSSSRIAHDTEISSSTLRKLASDESRWQLATRRVCALLDAYTLRTLHRTWDLTKLWDAYDQATPRNPAKPRKLADVDKAAHRRMRPLPWTLRFGHATLLVRLGLSLLPAADRACYEREWIADLQWLKQVSKPFLRRALGFAAASIRLAAVCWPRVWWESRIGLRIRKFEVLWMGALASIATFLAATAGLVSGTGSKVALVVAASVLAGVLLAWQEARKGRAESRGNGRP